MAVPRALFAEILRRIERFAAEAAAVLGMRIESDERRQPTGEVRSMIDRAQASEKTVPRDLGGALGALPRAAKRRKVDLREPASGESQRTRI